MVTLCFAKTGVVLMSKAAMIAMILVCMVLLLLGFLLPLFKDWLLNTTIPVQKSDRGTVTKLAQ
jgi:hypothetical protein